MSKKYKIHRVEITQRAQDRFDEMHENIQQHYSSKIATQFVNDFHDKVDQLKQNPAIYQFSDENKILDVPSLVNMELFYTKLFKTLPYLLLLFLILE